MHPLTGGVFKGVVVRGQYNENHTACPIRTEKLIPLANKPPVAQQRTVAVLY